MQTGPILKNEVDRLAALSSLEILDTSEEQSYDDLTYLAACLCKTPIALVSLIDEKRQWFKSHHGLDARETPREYAFCAHAIAQYDMLYVPESEKDERFFDNPLVTDEPYVKFYAGVPLRVNEQLVGTLCVIDNQPRELSDDQKQSLFALARQVEALFELRLKLKSMVLIDQMKDDFINVISHELKTPLTSIYGSLSLISKGSLLPKDKKFNQILEMAFINAERLSSLVNDILESMKLSSGKMEINRTKYNLNTLIDLCCIQMGAYFEKCKVSIETKLVDNLPDAAFDIVKISQVINNLLSNAAKFSPNDSIIIVETEFDDDYVTCKVIDHGQGIAEENIPYLCIRFCQLHDNKKDKISGSGLGLYICDTIIGLHDGNFIINSELDKGSQFCFQLPRHD